MKIMNALSGFMEAAEPEAFGAGRQRGLERKQTNAFNQAGQSLQNNDYEGASAALLGAGELQTGLQVRGMGEQRQQAQSQGQEDAQKAFWGRAKAFNENLLSLPVEQRPQVAQRLWSEMGFEQEHGPLQQHIAQEPDPWGDMTLQGEMAEARAMLGETPPEVGAQYNVLDQAEVERMGLGAGNYQRNDETGKVESIRGQGGIYGSENVQSTFTGDDGNLYLVKRNGEIVNSGQGVRNNQQFVNVGGVPAAFDPRTAAVSQLSTPQEVGGNAAQIETIQSSEKSRLAAQEDLPRLRDSTNQTIAVIDGLLGHEGFDSRYGLSSVIPAIHGTKGYGAQAYIEQIGGAAFLQAFESLKGGGQITEIEGNKATAAITRLGQQGISSEEARKAAAELKGILQQALSRMATRSTGEQGGALSSEISEADIQHTMQLHGVTREQVLQRLGGN